MTLNLVINEAGGVPACLTPPAATPYKVTAFFAGLQDAGHTFGPFANRPAAEQCAFQLAARGDVLSVKVEAVS